MRKFFRGLYVLILLAIIIGGVGYIGYSYFFVYNSNIASDIYSMNMTNNVTNNGKTMQGGMQHGSMTMQDQQVNTELAKITKNILSNQQSLENAIMTLNNSLSSLTLDPYSPTLGVINSINGTSHSESMGSMQMTPDATTITTVPDTTTPENVMIEPTTPGTGNTESVIPNIVAPDTVITELALPEVASPNEIAANNVNGNTTINIYPPNNNTPIIQGSVSIMMDMGVTYDQIKMEQLHNSLSKLAVGMQYLDELNMDISAQVDDIRKANTQDIAQFYSNQYTKSIEIRNSLNKALNQVKSATHLLNINPYISNNGLIYDKARMVSVHEGIIEMAKGMAQLEQFGDELVKQVIDVSMKAQIAKNNASMRGMTSHLGDNTSRTFAGLLNKISLPTLFTILLIVFVVLLTIGITGAITNLFKSPKQDFKLK